MLSTVSPSAHRSSLEEMLDSLRRRDELPNDIPPALPVRPSSKGRLPSLVRARRSLPINCKICSTKEPSGGGDSRSKSSTGAKREPSGANNEPKTKKNSSGAKTRPGLKKPDRFAELHVRIVDKDKRLVGLGSRKGSNVNLVELPGVESPYVKPIERQSGGERLDMSCQDSNSKGELASPSPANESDCNEDAGYVLKKNLRVWCHLADGQWELGQILSTTDEDVVVLLLDGRKAIVKKENLLPANPDILEGIDDLIQLSYLNEPSVLHNLHCRYLRDLIYTKAGPVLVAVNPFKKVPLYGSETISAYHKRVTDSPHVYAISETAFDEMMRDEVNQSIIISGESGAGKTETAKIAMQALAAFGGGSGIEYEVLETNPILEAFERLNLKAVGEYNYLNQSDCLKIDDVDDAQRFCMLLEALNIVQISKDDQENAFAMLAAVLWLGNISFVKPLGLLSLLDEESTFPSGTDLTFADKLKQHLRDNSCFKEERGTAFSILHYAGKVLYDTTAFLEKNRDLLHADSIQLLSSCDCYLPQLFASNIIANSERYGFLLLDRVEPQDPLSVSVAILQQFNILPDMYQVGYTKLFFRTGQDLDVENVQPKSSVLSELQRRVLNAETALREKENENAIMRERVQQYERRWIEYEARMRSMEEAWQKQMSSLQMSLAAAKKSLAADDMSSQAAKLDSPLATNFYDSEDATSGGSRTPETNVLLEKLPLQPSDTGLRDINTGRHAVGVLAREFEHRKKTFEDDVNFIGELKSNQSDSGMNPDDELRKLKMRFATWKKDYKARLRETKLMLQKMGNADGEKLRRKWWGKKSAWVM
ncbi:Myosin-2 [Nymphaea thermarum]|nr:Myosin-2 [Nymphaea thermarum]